MNFEKPIKHMWQERAIKPITSVLGIALLVAVPLISGCSLLETLGLKSGMSGTASTQPYTVSLTVTVDENVNQDINGRPSPLKTRVFLSESTVDFQAKQYNEIFRTDNESLNPAPLRTLSLRPGETRNIILQGMKSQPQLVIAAAYRKPGETRWLDTALLEVADKVEVEVSLTDFAVVFQKDNDN